MSPRKARTDKEPVKAEATRKRTASKKAVPGQAPQARTSERGNGHAMEDLYALISKRAYELFIARGAQPGHDFEDWLEAEKQVRSGAKL